MKPQAQAQQHTTPHHFVKHSHTLLSRQNTLHTHRYLNWASLPGIDLPWSDLHRRACTEAANSWSSYTRVGVPIMLGEWSLATNHDKPLDLDDPVIVKELRQLYREQLHVYSSSKLVEGAFYWALRMGSGWDPRPTDGYPKGRQLWGTSASKSFADYPYKVWSLLEMARAGIAAPIDEVAGACAGIVE